METRILTHAFALCLHIDDFATDAGAIAQDLSMDPTKYVSALFPPNQFVMLMVWSFFLLPPFFSLSQSQYLVQKSRMQGHHTHPIRTQTSRVTRQSPQLETRRPQSTARVSHCEDQTVKAVNNAWCRHRRVMCQENLYRAPLGGLIVRGVSLTSFSGDDV